MAFQVVEVRWVLELGEARCSHVTKLLRWKPAGKLLGAEGMAAQISMSVAGATPALHQTTVGQDTSEI